MVTPPRAGVFLFYMYKKENIKLGILVLTFCLFFVMLCVTLYSYFVESSSVVFDNKEYLIANPSNTEFKITKTVVEIENQRYESEITGETNVYDLMDQLRKEGKISFTEKNYTGMGKFIDSINGKNRDKKHNWIFYVNNEKSGMGVSNYQIKNGDVVSWKYEENY